MLETPLVEEASPGPRAPGVEVELERHTFMVLWGELTLTLKDMARLNTLPILGIPISWGVVLEGEDELKLKYLISLMTFSRTSGNLIMPHGWNLR